MKDKIQSIQRAVAILKSFTEQEPELGVSELSRRLGLHKSTVSRILATLQSEGLVSQNGESGKYALGVGLVSLAGVALGRLDVRGVAQPHLNQLAETSEETINVTIRDGYECINIDRVASPKSIRYVGWIGRRTPMHCTAAGKVLLAYQSPHDWDSSLPLPLAPYTSKTVIDTELLKRDLTHILEQGYAIVHEEFEEGFSGIAAPICNHAQHVIAAVSISGPTFRLGDKRLQAFIKPLLDTTRQISVEMGYR